MRLEKARLVVYSDPSGDAEDIEFMFNPTELDFTRTIRWNSDVGNRGNSLLPKVNFSGVEPYTFTLQNLLFDTYETKTSVVEEYIENIKKGATARTTAHARPPVYVLTWEDTYFHCVMTSLNYRLTLFLSDGTPVKAIVNISLQEVDPKTYTAKRLPKPTGRQDPRLNNSGGVGNSRNGRGNSGRASNSRGAGNSGSGKKK